MNDGALYKETEQCDERVGPPALEGWRPKTKYSTNSGTDSFYEALAEVYVRAGSALNRTLSQWEQCEDTQYTDSHLPADFRRWLSKDIVEDLNVYKERFVVLDTMDMVYKVDRLFVNAEVHNPELPTGGQRNRLRPSESEDVNVSTRISRMIPQIRKVISKQVTIDNIFSPLDCHHAIRKEAMKMWRERTIKSVQSNLWTETETYEPDYVRRGTKMLTDAVAWNINHCQNKTEVTELEMNIAAIAFDVFIYVYFSTDDKGSPMAIYGPPKFFATDETLTTNRISILYDKNTFRYNVNFSNWKHPEEFPFTRLAVSYNTVEEQTAYYGESLNEKDPSERKREVDFQLELVGGKMPFMLPAMERRRNSLFRASKIIRNPAHTTYNPHEGCGPVPNDLDNTRRKEKGELIPKRMLLRSFITTDHKVTMVSQITPMADVDWKWCDVMEGTLSEDYPNLKRDAEALLDAFAVSESNANENIAIDLESQVGGADDILSEVGKKFQKYQIYLQRNKSKWNQEYKTAWHYVNLKSGLPHITYQHATDKIINQLWETYHERPVAKYKKCFPPTMTNAQNATECQNPPTINASPDITTDVRMSYVIDYMSGEEVKGVKEMYTRFMCDEYKQLQDVIAENSDVTSHEQLNKIYDEYGGRYMKSTDVTTQKKQPAQVRVDPLSRFVRKCAAAQATVLPSTTTPDLWKTTTDPMELVEIDNRDTELLDQKGRTNLPLLPCFATIMPSVDRRGYYSAFKAWQEFDRQLRPKNSSLYTYNKWPQGPAALTNDILINGIIQKDKPRTNLITILLQEYCAHAYEMDPGCEDYQFIGPDHREHLVADKLTKLVNSIVTNLLQCFPVNHTQSSELKDSKELNSIMDFICWYMTNAWVEYTPKCSGKVGGNSCIHDKLCQLVCLPALSTWHCKGPAADKKAEERRDEITRKMMSLWRFVTFSKKALDYGCERLECTPNGGTLRDERFKPVVEKWTSLTISVNSDYAECQGKRERRETGA